MRRSNPVKRPVDLVDEERFTARILRWAENIVESDEEAVTTSRVRDAQGREYVLNTYLSAGGTTAAWVLLYEGRVASAGSLMVRDNGTYKVDASATHPDFRGRSLYQVVLRELRKVLGPIVSGSTMSTGAIRAWEKAGGTYDSAFDVYTLNPVKRRPNPTVFHGTPAAFLVSKARVAAGVYGPGLYFTSSFREASEYARKRNTVNQGVLACEVELRNPIEWHRLFQPLDLKYSEFLTTAYPNADKIREVLRLVAEDEWSPERGADAFRNAGYDGIIVHLRKTRAGGPEQHVSDPALADKTYYVVFSPQTLSCVWRDPV